MKFCTISDVHIKRVNDDAYKLFKSFLNSEECKKSDAIFFLGDIFDLIVGGHVGYYLEFREIFDEILKYAQTKRVVFVEGNHDFHFKGLVEYLNKENKTDIEYYDEPFEIIDCGKTILLAHGDELEKSNKSYQRYRKFIRSRFIDLLANDVVTYNFVSNLGIYLSNKSRKRNIKNYGHETKRLEIRKRFLGDIKSYLNTQGRHIDMLVCGHSHEEESTQVIGKEYYNNGYFPKTRKFLYCKDGSASLVTLD
jgi:UDP-2,3-diacylglucosamine hydrolase